MKFKAIYELAVLVKSYVEKHHELPAKMSTISKAEYSYLFTKTVMNPGKEIAQLHYKDAPNPTGDVINKVLTRKEYQDIASDVNNFVSPNKRLPNYDKYQNKKININLCVYCFAKIIKFYGENHRLPNTCKFDSSVFKSSSTSKYTTKGGKVCKQLMKLAKMSINTYNDVYKAIAKIFTYDFYYDDVQTQAQTIARRKGNCTDLNQVERAALKELDYDVQIVRGLVRCNDGKNYGHVWCRIKINGKWINIDASAAAKGKPIGSVICAKVVEITNINPSWAVSDDGKT